MSPAEHKPVSTWLVVAACLVAIPGVAAIWTGAAMVLRNQAGWFALVAALDAVVILRLAGWPPGRWRAIVALLVTLLTVLAANGMIAAAQIGSSMGLRLAEALPRMSLELTWLFALNNNGFVELLCIAAASASAWWLAR